MSATRLSQRLVFSVALAAAAVLGCGGNEDAPGGGSGAAGGGGVATTGGTSGSGGAGGTGAAPTSGGAAGGTATGGSSAGTSSAGAAGTAAGSAAVGGNAGESSGAGAPGSSFDEPGVCGHRGEATVTSSGFSGFEEYFLIGEEGFGSDICVVRFDVERVGDAPAGCTDCEWSHRVVLSNPTIVEDEGGVCADSELALDEDAIDALDGSSPAYGYVNEFAGHVSMLMKYDEDRAAWDAFGSARYDPEAMKLEFERRNGNCNY